MMMLTPCLFTCRCGVTGVTTSLFRRPWSEAYGCCRGFPCSTESKGDEAIGCSSGWSRVTGTTALVWDRWALQRGSNCSNRSGCRMMAHMCWECRGTLESYRGGATDLPWYLGAGGAPYYRVVCRWMGWLGGYHGWDDDFIGASAPTSFVSYCHGDGYSWSDFGSKSRYWAARALDRFDGSAFLWDYVCTRASTHYEDSPLYFVDLFFQVMGQWYLLYSYIFVCIYEIIFWWLSWCVGCVYTYSIFLHFIWDVSFVNVSCILMVIYMWCMSV